MHRRSYLRRGKKRSWMEEKFHFLHEVTCSYLVESIELSIAVFFFSSFSRVIIVRAYRRCTHDHETPFTRGRTSVDLTFPRSFSRGIAEKYPSHRKTREGANTSGKHARATEPSRSHSNRSLSLTFAFNRNHPVSYLSRACKQREIELITSE